VSFTDTVEPIGTAVDRFGVAAIDAGVAAASAMAVKRHTRRGDRYRAPTDNG
jgi:hypothetical protein